VRRAGLSYTAAVATPVLMVSPLSRPGGAERAFASLVRRLPGFGFEPVVALLEPGPLADWLDGRCELIDARPTAPLHLARTAATVRRLRGLALRSGARAVVSSKTRGHLFGGPAALAAGLPAVWWVHETPPAGWLYRRRESWRRYHVEEPARWIPAARVVCGNEIAAAAQRRRTPGRPLCAIRPGLPVDEVAARRGEGAAVRARLGLGDRPLVGIVGRLDPIKGHDLFVEAAALVARERPDVRFPVVGGELVDADAGHGALVAARARELGVEGALVLTGHQADAIPWIDALDVLVIASRSEGGPLVLGEAMALGKPVVATRVPGPADVLEHGRTGLLVPHGDARAMAAAILELLSRPARAAALGREARASADQFCDRRMAERFAGVLAEVTA
jgi:glycosyltransferase involved in cell wall biosynthesis